MAEDNHPWYIQPVAWLLENLGSYVMDGVEDTVQDAQDRGTLDVNGPRGNTATWEEWEWEDDEYALTTVGQIGRVIGWITGGQAYIEDDRERIRHWSVRGESVYPTDPDRVANLFGSRRDLHAYGDLIADETGRFDDLPGAYHESNKNIPTWQTIRAAYLRGHITSSQVTQMLEGMGYHDRHLQFQASDGSPYVSSDQEPGGWGVFDRPDRTIMRELFQELPGIAEIIKMETRDAFPREPWEISQDLQAAGPYAKWKQHLGTGIDAYDWTPGAGEDGEPDPILDALKQSGASQEHQGDPLGQVQVPELWEGPGSPAHTPQKPGIYHDWETYGPPSFAVYWMGGRNEYTRTYEKMAQALGLDPYLAMKEWESHWAIPGWRMIRRVLWRSPKVTPAVFKALLRWQDYPPGLLDPMVDASYRPLTRVDTRRMHLRGVFSFGRVFISFLDHGYSPENAALMSQFTVTWNMERRYSDVIDATMEAFQEKAITQAQAKQRLTDFIFSEIPGSPQDLPDGVRQRLSSAQQTAVLQAWREARGMQETWIDERLQIAAQVREIETRQEYLETAKQQYTGWAWRARETKLYLTERGFSPDRANALIDQWQPEREREERLPSRSMLEEFLERNLISVSDFREYMSRKGYGDAILDSIVATQEKLPTRSMLEEMYIDGIISESMLREYLSKLGYPTGTIDKLVEAVKEQAEESQRRANVITLREGFKKGEITESNLRDELEAADYSDKSVELIVRLAKRDREAYLQQQQQQEQQQQSGEESS